MKPIGLIDGDALRKEYLLAGKNKLSLAAVINRLEMMPILYPVDAAPVIHATTSDEYSEEVYGLWKTCNNCKGDNISTAKYCNWCGAKLDGEKE